MKYDCEFIQDVITLYKDNILNAKSREIVEEHLRECEVCNEYYSYFSEDKLINMSEDIETKNLSHLSKKIKEYRIFQIGMFLFTIISILTMGLTWFGFKGVTEISGVIVLQHPLAMIGIALFIFSIWYNFKMSSHRMICGYIGWGTLLIIELIEFLTVRTGNTLGIQFGPFSYDVPNLAGINFIKSLNYAQPGFFIGIISTVIVVVAFSFFVQKTKP